jgi:hypothetical protein
MTVALCDKAFGAAPGEVLSTTDIFRPGTIFPRFTETGAYVPPALKLLPTDTQRLATGTTAHKAC